ncbi:MAG: tripartite tricarboxylate transporter TctB family protein [Micropepsaceae bacterium]
MNKDLIASALLLVVAALYYAATVRIPVSTLGGAVGPHFFPTFLALLLGIVGVSLALRTLFVKRPFTAKVGAAKASGPDDGEATPLRALGLLGVGALYIPFALLLGYVPALFLLIASIALYEKAKPSWRMAAIAIAGALLFWLLFVALLGVRQPQSILF